MISKIQDGGGGHLENTKNCNISAMERPIFTKFGEVMCLGHLATVSQWNFVNSTIKDGGRRHLEKSKILISSQPIDRFGRNLACWCVLTLSAPIANKISQFQKILDGGNGHFENSKNCNISTRRRLILTTFSMMMSLCLPNIVCQWNFTNLKKIQDGDVRHFEKLKNLSIFVTDWPILPKFDILMSFDPPDPVSQKFGDFKNERWLIAVAIWKIEKLQYICLSLIHIWRCRRSTLCRSRWSPYH